MPTWLLLTRTDGKPVMINFATVAFYAPFSEGTSLKFVDSDLIVEVSEDFQTVKQRHGEVIGRALAS